MSYLEGKRTRKEPKDWKWLPHLILYCSLSNYPIWIVLLNILLAIIPLMPIQYNVSRKIYKFLRYLSVLMYGLIPSIIASWGSEQLELAKLTNLALIIAVPTISLSYRDILSFILVNLGSWLYYWSVKSPQTTILQFFGSHHQAFVFFGMLVVAFCSLLQFAKAHSKLKTKLKETKKQLEEKTAQEDVFLQFSHELRNPVNALLGSIELASSTTSGEELREYLKNAAVSSEFLLHIVNNLLDSNKLKTENLVFNPQNHDLFGFIESFWRMTSAMIKRKHLEGALEVSKTVPRYLNFDKHRVTQILLNLTSNALKFTETGSIRIIFDYIKASEFNESVYESFELEELYDDVGAESVAANAPMKLQLKPSRKQSARRKPTSLTSLYSFIQDSQPNTPSTQIPQKEYHQLNLIQKHFTSSIYQQRHENASGYLRIEVIDTGCGMTPEQSEKLFSKYGQVSDDKEKRQKGTGLGLWITRELCKLMGGDARVNSYEGVGSSFVIVIKADPYNPEVPPNMPASISQDEKSFASPLIQKSNSDTNYLKQYVNKRASEYRVLMADDTLYSQDVLKKLFEKAGMKEVTCVSNGKEAMDEYKRRGPNYYGFLIFDVNMPVMGGIEAAEEIRRYEVENNMENIPIIFLTGESSEKKKNMCLAEDGPIRGFKYIVKPLLFTEIQRIVREVKLAKAQANKIDSLSALAFDEPQKRGSFGV